MNVVDAPLPVCCQVEAAIERRCGWQVHNLQVEIRNECVVLRGWAATYYVKQLAQQAALVVTGRTMLINQIVVR